MNPKQLARSAALLISILLAPVAFAQEVRFYVTNNYTPNSSPADVDIYCSGPYFRHTGSVSIPANAKNQLFYTAEVNLLPPFGTWGCKLSPSTDAIWGICFDLDEASTEVHIKINGNKISVDKPISDQCLFEQAS